MKRSLIILLVSGLLLFLVACGRGSIPALEEVTQPAATGTLKISISNQGPYDICYVQISGSEQEEWGRDWLGEQEKIAPGASKTFNVDAGTYDVKVMTCEQYTLATFWGIDSNTTVEVGGKGLVPLVVSNQSTTEICYLYIVPSSSNSWGEDWLGKSESIPPQEGGRVFFVQPGTYDLSTQDCDRNDLVTRSGLQITEATSWTISD